MPREFILVPTAHVLEKSVKQVKKVIEETKPDAVAVELDFMRYQAMVQNKQRGPMEFVKRGHIFAAVLTIFQNWIAKKMKIFPGAEMLEAVKVAGQNSIPVLFIDRPFSLTLQRFSKVPLLEKLRLFTFVFAPIDIEDITKPENVHKLLEILKKKSPTLSKVLVDERDKYMVSRLLKYNFEKTVVVIGAGHVRGISTYLSNLNKPKTE